MIKKLLLYIILLFTTLMSKAQDPHFSQYQASPLTINPAMTGLMTQDYRTTVNYRTQYWSVGSNFTTGTISFEKKIQPDEFESNSNRIAWGIMGLYDMSGNGGYKSMNLAFSGAYGKILDIEQTQQITVGFQAVLSTRAMNISGLSFANQFTSGGFDLSLPNHESYFNGKKTYGDINSGLLYSYQTSTQRFYAGASMYHINKPNISFSNDEKFRLPSRYVLHSGYRFVINDKNTYVLLNANYMKQAGATNLLAGGAVGYYLTSQEYDIPQIAVSAGCWYRQGDAVIPYFGLDWKSYQLGVTYDILNSGIKNVSPKTGGFEISFRYAVTNPLNPFIHNVIGREF